MVQLAVGMMGFFIIHPKKAESPQIDRDFAIMLHEWAIHPGTYRPDPAIMTDFNIFSFNSKVFPAIDHLVVKTGDRVRIRIANLSMDEHPIHIHGHSFRITATDGGKIPRAGHWPETTVLVPVGSTRDAEFIADAPGDWAFHCHKSHHTMNPMGHDIPNTLGATQKGLEERIRKMIPGYMAMGEAGMAEHMGKGPFGNIEMGGMFTVVKVRDHLKSYDEDPGWYKHPEKTIAYRLDKA
jgi:FtsP/CotA-like multicopper oxidase with cupredoxin domain